VRTHLRIGLEHGFQKFELKTARFELSRIIERASTWKVDVLLSSFLPTDIEHPVGPLQMRVFIDGRARYELGANLSVSADDAQARERHISNGCGFSHVERSSDQSKPCIAFRGVGICFRESPKETVAPALRRHADRIANRAK
jgi:hypothetical protein